MYKTASKFLRHSRERQADNAPPKRLKGKQWAGAEKMKRYLKKWRKIARGMQ